MNVITLAGRVASEPARRETTKGVVTEFRTKGFTNTINTAAIRTMDCMDCHNRPAHTYQSPNDAVNLAMSLGNIDSNLKWIKTNAVYTLTRKYTNETHALQSIATHLASQYPNEPGRAGAEGEFGVPVELDIAPWPLPEESTVKIPGDALAMERRKGCEVPSGVKTRICVIALPLTA